MKRIVFIRLMAVLLAMIPLSLLSANTIIYTANYNNENTVVGTDTLGGVTYTTVYFEGLYNN